MRSILIACLACFLFSCHRTATVNRIIDGDTFTIHSGEKIRLAEVDAPEMTQAFGWEARAELSRLILNKTIELKKVDRDKYGRLVCEVYCNGIWINQQLIRDGYAWAYNRYAGRQIYLDELIARSLKKGIWAKDGAIPPFIFRKKH